MPSAKIKGLALKLYDSNFSDEDRCDYWEKTMSSIYFNDPDKFLSIISNTCIYPFLKRFLPERGFFLDGGCGSNYFADLFDTDERKIIGLDFAVENLIKGKDIYPDAWSVAGDLNDLPFRDEVFDGVLSISSAEHIEDGPLKLFQETYRTLKRGGIFLLLIPTFNIEDMLCHIVLQFFGRGKYGLYPIPHPSQTKSYKAVKKMQSEELKGFFAYWLSRRTIKNMLAGVGFKIERSFTLDVMGGLARSRLLGKLAIDHLQKTFLSLMGIPSSQNIRWIDRVFVQENIYGNRLECIIHGLIGTFYRSAFAFVCKKPLHR